jgi:glycosyltransferase involved in cell wall biosynthesis
MAELNVRQPDAHLVIVGGVHKSNLEYWNRVQSYAQNRGVANVTFAGHQEDVTPYLALFRVFVMISDRQGCPNASLEAMALGLPVVANPNGGTAEQIEDGVNGFLVSDQDPSEMAERIHYLLSRPDARAQFGEAGKRIVQEKFSMERMVRGYMDLFRSPRA